MVVLPQWVVFAAVLVIGMLSMVLVVFYNALSARRLFRSADYGAGYTTARLVLRATEMCEERIEHLESLSEEARRIQSAGRVNHEWDA